VVTKARPVVKQGKRVEIYMVLCKRDFRLDRVSNEAFLQRRSFGCRDKIAEISVISGSSFHSHGPNQRETIRMVLV
jgi:hypothetical protein